MNEFEHTLENHSHEEICNHSFSQGALLFKVITVDNTKLHVLHTVLKQDHPYDCAKCMSSHAVEERRSNTKPSDL